MALKCKKGASGSASGSASGGASGGASGVHPGASGLKRVHPSKWVCARTEELPSGGSQGLQPLNPFIILKRLEALNFLEFYSRVAFTPLAMPSSIGFCFYELHTRGIHACRQRCRLRSESIMKCCGRQCVRVQSGAISSFVLKRLEGIILLEFYAGAAFTPSAISICYILHTRGFHACRQRCRQ